MGNPNPFYRFKQGWNAGFYPDNQIVSDLLNEIEAAIIAALPSIAVIGTTTTSQLKASFKAIVDQYNVYPYYGNFKVTMSVTPSGLDYFYVITVKDEALSATDSTQQIEYSGVATNPGKTLVNIIATGFTPGAYTGAFDATLVAEEERAAEALNVVNLNGSAFFPITYNYDSTSGVATSGLARAKNLILSNGIISRLPGDSLPRMNKRTFQLPQLNGDDSYVISLMERIIQASLQNTDYTTSILATYNSFALPDGWVGFVSYPFYTTYQRVQFDFVNSTRRAFSLVGRKDSGSWLWQRFVSDNYPSGPYDFTASYTETTALPYEPNQAGRWLYNSDTYDYEFVEFTSGCYVSPEFYPMPAKPGDQWQFNVPSNDGNLTGLTTASVGLFTQDGQFIQKIGEAVNAPCCFEILLAYQTVAGVNPNFTSWSDLIDSINSLEVSFKFQFSNQTLNYLGTTASSQITADLTDFILEIPAPLPYDRQEFIDLMAAQSWGYGITVFGEFINNGVYEGVKIKFCNYENAPFPSIVAYYVNEGSLEPIYQSYINSLCCPKSQFQATSLIPAVKNGCYRMGLYRVPVIPNTCEGIFQVPKTEIDLPISGCEWIDEVIAYPDEYFGLFLTDSLSSPYENKIYLYKISVSDLLTGSGTDFCNFWTNLTNWLDTIPEMSYTLTWPDIDECNSEEKCGYEFGFLFTPQIPCSTNYRIIWGILDSSNNLLEASFNFDPVSCECPPPDPNDQEYYLYSLSNIINIDRSECFSTILEFWADSNSIAQGMEYYNDWKQRVRIGLNGGGEKPIIEESLYRQSNGVHRRPQNKQDLSLDLHTDFFDLETQLAMTDATRHPYLIWEGKSIFVKGDIEVATTQDFTTQSSFETLSQMKFQALIQGFQPRNSSCLTC